MNSGQSKIHKDDLQVLKEFRTDFDSLYKEAMAIHKQWQKLDKSKGGGGYHLELQSELIERESEVLEKIAQLLNSATELIKRFLSSAKF